MTQAAISLLLIRNMIRIILASVIVPNFLQTEQTLVKVVSLTTLQSTGTFTIPLTAKVFKHKTEARPTKTKIVS